MDCSYMTWLVARIDRLREIADLAIELEKRVDGHQAMTISNMARLARAELRELGEDKAA